MSSEMQSHSEQQKESLIRYRLERAWETLEDANILAERQRWNASTNRLYYACFYAASALLLFHDLSAKTHVGVRRLIGHHFLRTGVLNEALGDLYNDLFEKRMEGDYKDLVR